MERKLRIGLVGVGIMGKNYARLLADLETVDFVGIYDIDLAHATKLAQKYHTTAHNTYDELLSHADAIIIAVPTTYHLPVARKAIEHGKHVLVEKPLADTIDACKAIITLSKEKNVKLAVGHIEQFNPVIQLLHKKLHENILGRVFKVKAIRSGPLPFRITDVNVLLDLGVHDIDIICSLFNTTVDKAQSVFTKAANSVTEDSVYSVFTLNNGVIGLLEVDWLSPVKTRKIIITGEKGMLEADYITQELKFYENAFDPHETIDVTRFYMGIREGNIISYHVDKQEPLRAELESFIRAVSNNTSVEVTGEDGLRALQEVLKLNNAKL